MTGEISLRGKVLPIGGLREKAMAAYMHRMKLVIIPEENVPDLAEVEDVVKSGMEFLSVSHYDEVMRAALTHMPATAVETSPLTEAAIVPPAVDNPRRPCHQQS